MGKSKIDLNNSADPSAPTLGKLTHRPTGLIEQTNHPASHSLNNLRNYQTKLERQNEQLRAAREELDAARRKYLNLYNFAPVGYFTFDASGRIKEVNLTGARLLGANKRFLLNKPFSAHIDTESRAVFRTHLREVIKKRKSRTCEIRLVRGEDMAPLYVQLQSTPIESSEGEAGCWSVVSDITVLKRAEEERNASLSELQEANRQLKMQKTELERLMQELISHRDQLKEAVEERTRELRTASTYLGHEILERVKRDKDLKEANDLLEKVFSNINVAIAYLDTDFRFIRVNRSYAEAEGLDPEFFAGKNHFDLFPHMASQELFRRVVATGEPYTAYGQSFKYFRSYRRKNEYWDWNINPVKEEDGTVSGVILNLVNITNRRRAEAALRESEKKFRRLSQEFNALLDAIPDTLLLLSPDLKILWANKGAANFLGKSISDLTGQYCYTLWHHRDDPCENCYVKRCFNSGREENATTKVGDTFLSTRAFPIIDEGGVVTNVIVTATDITEKMELQAEVMRADHLASLGKMAAGVAHEINNPINGIINYAQIIANRSEGGSKEHDIACRIIKEGDRIATIVKSLLSFARDRKGLKSPVQIKDLIADTLFLTEAQLRKEGIKLTVHIPDMLPEVVVNAQQIQQVFFNIINNARYALNQKYPGRHEEKILEISGEQVVGNEVPSVRITFHDRGTGIPADILDKVKDPFFSTKPTGTGLGLSISHGIISDHGGKLLIRSTEQVSTMIIIELPARKVKHGH
ncbi:MAG: PAS domain-containing protein [Nitrospirota bacterium]